LQVVKDGMPKDDLSKEIADLIADEGIKVLRGSNRTVCDIWPCRKWDRQSDFKPTAEVQYPFTQGQLMGVLRFRRRSTDFRDQQISSGVYTLRYGQQPVDGNHVGTSPTRDFLLLLKAEDDRSPGLMGEEELMKLSAEAAGSSHPAMMWLNRRGNVDAAAPSLYHDEDRDWWILRLSDGKPSDSSAGKLSIDLVVVGHAEE
jgi:hypothetical protein